MAIVVVALLLPHVDHAGLTFVRRAKLTLPSGSAHALFGREVRLSDDGSTALVLSDKNCYTAYFLARGATGWTLQQAIEVPGSKEDGCYAGLTGALSGDGNTALVATSVLDGARVFVRSAGVWVQQAELTLGHGWTGFLPLAISDDGNTALVGAPGEDCVDLVCGAAYIFVRDGDAWTPQQKLARPDTQVDGFGGHVAVSGDGTVIAVGAIYTQALTPGLPDVSEQSGVVYLFIQGAHGWLLHHKLFGADDYDRFGATIELSDDGSTALIGAVSDECSGNVNCGSVYPFLRSGDSWTQMPKLAVDINFDANFGGTISASSDAALVLVGAQGKDCATGTYCGSSYLFRRTGDAWIHLQELVGGDVEGYDHYGNVALSDDGTVALVGAPAKDCTSATQQQVDIPKTNCGAVYVFTQKCHTSLATETDCELTPVIGPDDWIGVGCKVVDCCPGCPGRKWIDWIMHVTGDPVEAVVLRFENLPAQVIRRLRVIGAARWLDRNRLQIEGRDPVLIRGFSPATPTDLRSSLHATRMTLDRVVVERDTNGGRDEGISVPGHRTLRIHVQQKVGDITIADSTLTFRTR